jgi:hypothetical protein
VIASEAHMARGHYDEVMVALTKGIDLAMRSVDRVALADGWLWATWIAIIRSHYAEAGRYLRFARSAVEAAGNEPRSTARLALFEGHLSRVTFDYDTALMHYRRSLAIIEAHEADSLARGVPARRGGCRRGSG